MKVSNLLLIFSFMTASLNMNAQTATQVENVNVATFKKMMTDSDVVIVDVRTPKEVAQGTIEGAINIPLSTVSQKVLELDKAKKYLLFCRSGRRSARASSIFAKQGLNVVNLKGGFLAYSRY